MRRTRAGRRWIGYLLVWAAMMLARMDLWWWTDATRVFGLVPIGLASQVVYTLLAAIVMWALVRWDWPRELERFERDEPDGPRGAA